MKTYSVKQIAELLNTNPETVRRWIRNGKLNAVQTSRKDGNIVTEEELERFVKATPKYLKFFPAIAGMAALAPLGGIGVLASGIVTSALIGFYKEKNINDIRVRADDFKDYLKSSVIKLDQAREQKQNLIKQTETEINELTKQIDQYNYMLEHEDLLIETLKNANLNGGKLYE